MAVTTDSGTATIEYIGVAMALIVPIAYCIVTFAHIQSAQLGVVGAAQQAARAYVNASSDLLGRYAAPRAAAIAGRNHGLLIGPENVVVTCAVPNCLAAGTAVTVDVTSSVKLAIGTLPLHARSTMTVDAFRADPM